jgi:signal peptidase I
MTIQPPQTEDQPPRPNGTHRDTGVFDPPSVVAPDDVSRVRTMPARRRRAPDYRLRGLDLDAPDVAEAQPKPVRALHPSQTRRRRRLLVQWGIVVAVIATVAVLVRIYVVQPYSVSSSAMVPTLARGTDVLVVKPSVLSRSIKAGDIVVFHAPKGATCANGESSAHDVVERVIGMPGETIWSAGGTIFINGQRLNEPGWYNVPFGELGPTAIARTTIPSGSYFVMGDNRTDSCDSRSFGAVHKSLVVGKVVATIARDGHPSVHSI